MQSGILLTRAGGWAESEGSLRMRDAGASLKVAFVGNRIDLLDRRTREGGKTRILVSGVRSGDQFSFDVERTATPEVDFHAPQGAWFSVPLVRNLLSGPHTLEVIASGDGEVVVEGFYIYERPLTD